MAAHTVGMATLTTHQHFDNIYLPACDGSRDRVGLSTRKLERREQNVRGSFSAPAFDLYSPAGCSILDNSAAFADLKPLSPARRERWLGTRLLPEGSKLKARRHEPQRAGNEQSECTI